MPNFFYLTEILIKELEEKGASIYYIENKNHNFDYAAPTSKFRLFRKIYHTIKNTKWNYLKKYINFEESYDFFICINGFSFDKRIIEKLKIKNPQIKNILYLWDSTHMYNWIGIEKLFDSAFTFDPLDAQYLKIKYLPNFYPKEINKHTEKITNDLFFVGTQHDDRFTIISKITTSKSLQSVYYIKLLVKYKNKLNNKLIYNLLSNINNTFCNNYCLNYKLIKHIYKADFLIYEALSPNIILHEMQSSKCILDIQSPSQVGLPHQMILALAMNKKIITTNKWIVNYDFYNSKQITIIDRNNPIIDNSFLVDNFKKEEIHKSIENCRIDNWLNELFSDFI